MGKKILTMIIVSVMVLIAGIYYFRREGQNLERLDANTNIAKDAAVIDENLVEIFYLPHPPAVAVVKKVEEILKKYPRYTVKKYDFDDSANDKVVSEHNLSGHIPVAIFIAGENTFTIDGKEITFVNFPKSDTFAPSFGGSWDYANVEKALAKPDKY